jgi:succinylglutamate desuccinylase
MDGTAATRQKDSSQEDHTIASFVGDESGPTLIVVGSIHGNEPSGSRALRNVAQALQSTKTELRGRVFFLQGNLRASNARSRFIDSDLNRHWTPVNIALAESTHKLDHVEDLELRELLGIFEDLLASARNEVFVLDLHSTSANGIPFATVGDTLRNRHFAQKFPVTMLLGIEEQLKGTLLEYLNNQGAVTLGFEGGQHDSAEAIANHEALIWMAIVNSGIAAADDIPDLETRRRGLQTASGRMRVVEIRYREAITANDEFVMNPGFKNFDPIKRGQILANDRHGYIKAVEGGMILMPLYQSKGEDGFFIGREVAPFWIRLSELLRKLKLADWMFILPGVRRHPTDPESLIVNTAVARIFPLQIFHLLGFRRRVWEQNCLIVSRRRHDIESPFVKQVKPERQKSRWR